MNDPLLYVNETYEAIQGEGALTGTPMHLIRLQGCNLRCPWCDTKQTWDRADTGIPMTNEELLAQVRLDWILLTGGEPLLQPVEHFIAAARAIGKRVAIETNGTLSCADRADWMCVSPKVGTTISRSAWAMANEIKMVVEREEDLTWFNALLASMPTTNGIFSLQPASQDPGATTLCIREVIERRWRLSIQTHKYLSLP